MVSVAFFFLSSFLPAEQTDPRFRCSGKRGRLVATVSKEERSKKSSYLDRRGGVSERHRAACFFFLLSSKTKKMEERLSEPARSFTFSFFPFFFLISLKKIRPSFAMSDEAAAKLAEASINVSSWRPYSERERAESEKTEALKVLTERKKTRWKKTGRPPGRRRQRRGGAPHEGEVRQGQGQGGCQASQGRGEGEEEGERMFWKKKEREEGVD